ncbi:hypothetical protein F5877DRAFT_65375 [Lentinula edodes]|nr:hypothetical protein F5877DRAFT_65375 [Lentinula edodes]
MRYTQLYGISLCVVLGIFGLVCVALGSPIQNVETAKSSTSPNVIVQFHGTQPVDEGIMQIARVNVQTLLHLSARKIPGTPDLTVHEWQGNPQFSAEDKHVTFLVIVTGLGKEDSWGYTGYYTYTGVPRPYQLNDMKWIERVMTAKLIDPHGNTVLELPFAETSQEVLIKFGSDWENPTDKVSVDINTKWKDKWEAVQGALEVMIEMQEKSTSWRRRLRVCVQKLGLCSGHGSRFAETKVNMGFEEKNWFRFKRKVQGSSVHTYERNVNLGVN